VSEPRVKARVATEDRDAEAKIEAEHADDAGRREPHHKRR
jgi:hypothetical protein